MKMPTLRVENVSKRFGGLAALQGVSLEARPGRVTSIIGQNGAGKTTLINAIAQLPPPDSGRIFVGEQELTGKAPSRAVRCGVARTFQQLRMFPHLTVLDNVLLGFQGTRGEAIWRLLATPLTVHGEREEHRARAGEILRSLDLVHLADEEAGNLSYGLQKLLSLARVLATDAPVIMLDEPTSGLGRDFIDRILRIVTDMRARERTVVLVEHDMDVVFEISDWIVVLNQGTLFAQGRPAEIRANEDVRTIYFGSRVG
jgi:ABC-type branched-subunit amino acid transport system ATPase component